MDEILSQEEVNALIKGISEGKIETEGDEGLGEAEVCEFPRIEETDEEVLPRLERVARGIADALAESLTGLMKRPVEVESFSVRYETFGECLSNLPDMASLNLFTMDPLKGVGLLIFDAGMVFSLIDILFGGSGKTVVKREKKEFTPIESKVIQKIACTVLEDVETAWKEVVPVKVRFLRSETEPSDLTFLKADERVAVMEVTHAVDELKYRCQFCFPMKTLEPVREKLGGAIAGGVGSADWRKKLEEIIMTVPVEVKCLLGCAEIPVFRGLRLREGDTILLDSSPQDELPLVVEEVEKFRGRLGSFRGNYAVKVKRIITD